jgi:hypothetical protein
VLKLGHRRGPGGLRVTGGRNVVIVGGRITPVVDSDAKNGRGFTFYDQTGTVHVEGVQIDGAADGILISAPRATFQIQNVRISVSAPNHDFDANHPDAIQTWSGPAEVRIDGLTAISDYQGFLWMAADGGVYPGRVAQRRVNVRTDPGQGGTSATLHQVTSHLSPSTTFSCDRCWMETGWYRPNYRRKLQDSILGFDAGSGRYTQPPFRVVGRDGRVVTGENHRSEVGRRQGDRIEWPTVPTLAREVWHWGRPPGGDFVPAGLAGTDYVSPGYAGLPAKKRR